jgi:hypothetical protein
MRTTVALLALGLLVAACRPEPGKVDAGCDGALFGQPVPMTGLDGTQCAGTCSCSGFTSRDFTAAQLEALTAWTLAQPFAELTSNPYAEAVPERDPGVCAVVVEDLAARRYHLETFADPAAAADAGAVLTHHDACGRCSTLADFAVLVRDRDVGVPVKKCGVDSFGAPIERLVACIEGLGFTRPCAQAWAWNVRNTQGKCLEPCLFIGDGPYHQADGTLNACLACDEKVSGAVFKAVAGRTRRNTGLASSICRPCSETRPVAHDYPGL